MKKNKILIFIKKIFLLLLSICLFIFSNPNFLVNQGISYLGFFIYLPVLLLVNECSFLENIIYGGIFGAISYGAYAYWLMTFDSICLWAACIFYFIVLALVFVVLKLCTILFKKNGWIVQWLCICSYEYLKTLGFLGFSYGVTAYTQWQNTLLIQICSIIGVYGLNCFIIFISVCISALIIKTINLKNINLLKQKNEKEIESDLKAHFESEAIYNNLSVKPVLIYAGVWITLLAAFLVFGKIRISNNKYTKNVKIISIQSNESPWKNGIEEYTANVQQLINLTNEALELNEDADIIVWPETAVVPAIVYNYETKYDKRRYELVKYLLEYIDSQTATFVIGNGHEINSNKQIHDVYNSALVFTPQKNVLPPEPYVYSKNKLVPFSETFPYKHSFPSIYKKILNKQTHLWAEGKEIKVFNNNNFFFSTPICFEDTFPEICRKMAKKGSKCFINLTNDSWSNSVACQYQHLSMAVFRSVENGVPTVRSSTSGQTCHINQYGKITSMCYPFTSSYCVDTVNAIPQYAKKTIYTKIGDVFGIIPVIVFLIFLLSKGIFVIIKKSSK